MLGRPVGRELFLLFCSVRDALTLLVASVLVSVDARMKSCALFLLVFDSWRTLSAPARVHVHAHRRLVIREERGLWRR